MTEEDERAVFALIDRMKDANREERERISADLKTAVLMASEPDMKWEAPLILRQNNRTYRAYPIQD